MGGLLGLLFGSGLVMALWDRRLPLPRRRHRRVEPHWPQFVDDVASGVRAGVSVPVAMFEAGQRLDPCFQQLFAEAREFWVAGNGFELTMSSLRESIDSAAFDQFAQTVEIAHRQGGRSVATLLSQLARNVRAQEQLINEVRGRQSVTVTSAKVAVAAPWVVLALTCARPEVRESYQSTMGLFVLVAVALVCVCSYFAMRKVAEISAMQVMR